jgi:DNA-binding GntR family transcriptional regulator
MSRNPSNRVGLKTRPPDNQKLKRFARPKSAELDRKPADLRQRRAQPPAEPPRAAPRAQSLIDLDPDVKPRAAMVDRVYAFLKYKILTCKMTPGQMVSEKEVCDALSVSRTPFREALNRLCSEGLVWSSHYRAYQVTPLVESDIIDLCELRTIIEMEVAALAAQRGAPADVKRLESLLGEPAVRGTYSSYLAANSAFHSALGQCCQNARLAAIYASIMDQLQRPFYLGFDFGLDPAEFTSGHRELVKAIREGDSAKARKAVLGATQRTRSMILGALRTHGFV